MKYISSLSLVNKIILSFLLIIVVFIAILIYSIYFTAQIRDRHGYLSSYTMSRNRILTQFQRDFSGLTNLIRLTFNNREWLTNAPLDEIHFTQNEITRIISELQHLAEEYLQILSSDFMVNEIVGFDMQELASTNMLEVLDIIGDIQSYYVRPSPPVAFGEVLYFSDVLTVFGSRVTGIIGMLREHNLDVIDSIGNEIYRQQDAYFRFNLAALVAIVAIAAIAAWLLSSNIKKRILALEISADAMKQGYFDVNINPEGSDEIGRLTSVLLEVIYNFRDFVRQITYTSNEINEGNFSARLDESAFEGDYRKASIAINNLSKSVIQASAAKAEQEYYSYVKFMMDTVPSVISFWNENLELFDCNEEALRRYKITSKEEYLQKFPIFSPTFQPDGSPSTQKARQLMEEANRKGYLKFDWMHQDIDGNQIPSVITCYKGNLMGKTVIFTYCTDMRDFHKMLEEMERSASAEGSSKAKSRFLARMSHEIRTPISAVLGISEIQLQNPDLPLAVEEAFAKIYNSSQTLLGIINDILDLSKIEEEKMDILTEEYDTASLINDIIQLNIFRLGSKKIVFDIDIAENLPKIIGGDALRIKQIMNNLLSNAFKYTDEGSVVLRVFTQEDDKKFFLCFDVSDTGCGMSDEELKLLFHEFVRFNEERHHHIEGIGLGMHIVYNLVGLMGATIEVDSTVGVGTNFYLKIPQKHLTNEGLGTEMIENLKTFKLSNRFSAKRMPFKPDKMPYGKVLVVDDVETNLFVANGLLSFYGLNIETCDSGYKAIDLVREGNVYDIIFLDQMMPSMDGVETLRYIRAEGYYHPIIALTANALIGQSEFFLENGFDGFISKPIDTSHLNTILIKYIRDKQPQHVIDAANQATPETTTADDMWNFFSGDNLKDPENAFAKSLRKEFARSQKNIIADIRAALKAEDTVSCRRYAHTLKGLARTIGENPLADTAAKLELLFEQGHHNEQTTRLTNEMEQQLLQVLATIPQEEPLVYAPLPDDFDLAEILAELEPLLKDGNVDSLTVAEKLRGLPTAKNLINQIQDYDFDAALETLATLKAEN
ncbi:MAG: response regulator [Defluviitaleaceae bacterium]|nr:response regulator [Defluviitaleaceae bacterium]